jgi:nitroreductase
MEEMIDRIEIGFDEVDSALPEGGRINQSLAIYRAKMDDGTRQAIDQLLRTRRSIRRFTDRPVSKKLLLETLDVAGRAPSNSNMQPWRVYLVGGAAKDELARALCDAHQKSPADYQPERPMYAPNLPTPYSDRLQLFGRVFYGALGIDRADMEGRERQIVRNLIFFDAPIAAFFTVDRRMEVSSWFDCGLFVQTFMLAARATGLDTCAQIFLTKYHSVVRQHLPIDDSQIIACGMSIGYADTSSVEYTIDIPRIPVKEFASIVGLE